jgi:hypothetical protein
MPELKSSTAVELADLLEKIADRIAAGRTSFELQLQLAAAEKELLAMENLDGAKLLNRLGLLVLTAGNTKHTSHDLVRKHVEGVDPLDANKDSEYIRKLAKKLRGGS